MQTLLNKFDLLKIDNYKFTRELTGGNMSSSAIYSSEDGSKVIVKFLFYPRNDFELRRLQQEVESMEKVHDIYPDSNIPKLLTDLVKVENTKIYYFMMSFIDGKILSEYEDVFDNEAIITIIKELVGTLCNTLSSGIVHKDIHTGNIMVNVDENNQIRNVYLLDFGVSEDWLRNIFDLSGEDGFRHVGAISAWSPEFINNPRKITPKHDIWAIGVLFYYLLKRKWPVKAENFGDYMDIIQGDLLSSIDFENIHNDFIIHLIKRCLEKDQKLRISSSNLHKMLNDYTTGIIELVKKDSSTYIRYLECDGNLWVCPHCMQQTSPNGSICTKCGHKDYEFLPIEMYFNTGC